jgi:hypothetical protein
MIGYYNLAYNHRPTNQALNQSGSRDLQKVLAAGFDISVKDGRLALIPEEPNHVPTEKGCWYQQDQEYELLSFAKDHYIAETFLVC